ncbi:MAG TPA: hypothetical protein VMR43_06925 [Variovorax sp.]|nr:hypothetical protein [Variovorax sp.]
MISYAIVFWDYSGVVCMTSMPDSHNRAVTSGLFRMVWTWRLS